MVMNTMEPTAERTQDPGSAGAGDNRAGNGAGAWQAPGYTVVETALEVTAYSLATRWRCR
ncbi:pyrroloquinoline quinone precursor peptide PqqA [Streptomyces antnestii]|uniref:pyrroloquinoline quinone precursor peptide PqqA n=1 Tax=Streptomyces antnestii TaxID=2494256 RepID=UPI00269B0425|nr:pyrroloquinoline quinone precursor peptide PqqA [Streptomyces sp. San01]